MVDENAFPHRRYPQGTNGGTPYTVHDVADGCTVTLFDDGRVRMTIKPSAGWEVKHKLVDARFPGAKMLELRPTDSTSPDTSG